MRPILSTVYKVELNRHWTRAQRPGLEQKLTASKTLTPLILIKQDMNWIIFTTGRQPSHQNNICPLIASSKFSG